MKIVKPSVDYLNPAQMTEYQFIEKVGRTCYKSEDKITDGSAEKFVKGLVSRQHWAMMEHGYLYILGDEQVIAKLCSSVDDRYIKHKSTWLVGSFRAIYESVFTWIEEYGSTYEILRELNWRLKKQWPEVFGEADGEVPCKGLQHWYLLTREQFIKINENNPEVLNLMLPHTLKFTVDRGVTHELVRHRDASFAQESSRYCVAGDMKLNLSNHRRKLTIRELYENTQDSKNGAWKRMRLRQYNEQTGVLQYSKIKNVIYVGKKECIRIKTKLGYSLDCTPEHEILTPEGYSQASDISCGSKIYVNGTTALYKNYDWLYYQNITLNKTFVDIANEFGFNVNTLKKWGNVLGIPHKGTGYFHIGHTPWNKGIQDARQVEALRKYHHCGRRKDRILKEDTDRYQKHNTGVCAICGATEDLEVHHIDCNHSNHKPTNLMTVCSSCHQYIHSHNLQTAYADEVITIENIGETDVYDIEMNSDFHNFVANGIIVHNCNYSKGKYGSEITVVEPWWVEELGKDSETFQVWNSAMLWSEEHYMTMINKCGASAQAARAVLPQSTKAELIVTASETEWQHIIDLRLHGTTGAPHPDIKRVMEMALPLLKEHSDGRIV